MKLQGRCAVITGAGQGLGEAIAEHYVSEGASVLLCDRSGAVESVRVRLAAVAGKDQKVIAVTCDIAKPKDLEALFRRALADLPPIDILVNNAGVHGPLGHIEDIDWGQWVDAVSINLLGTVYACRLAVPVFKSRGYGKIINLSGGGATVPLPGISAYAASKAALVRFTETLAEELKDYRIDVNALAPGALKTRIMAGFVAAGPEKIGVEFHRRISELSAQGGTPLSVGARCCVYLGSAESDGITGKLVAAQWDPWPDFQSHMADLKGSDIYTLRRIIPKDRGKPWGDG
jgi:NAD(P)-dependent dehydrogenase (short-subunit alcohol dehydrogenase family)